MLRKHTVCFRCGEWWTDRGLPPISISLPVFPFLWCQVSVERTGRKCQQFGPLPTSRWNNGLEIIVDFQNVYVARWPECVRCAMARCDLQLTVCLVYGIFVVLCLFVLNYVGFMLLYRLRAYALL